MHNKTFLKVVTTSLVYSAKWAKVNRKNVLFIFLFYTSLPNKFLECAINFMRSIQKISIFGKNMSHIVCSPTSSDFECLPILQQQSH